MDMGTEEEEAAETVEGRSLEWITCKHLPVLLFPLMRHPILTIRPFHPMDLRPMDQHLTIHMAIVTEQLLTIRTLHPDTDPSVNWATSYGERRDPSLIKYTKSSSVKSIVKPYNVPRKYVPLLVFAAMLPVQVNTVGSQSFSPMSGPAFKNVKMV